MTPPPRLKLFTGESDYDLPPAAARPNVTLSLGDVVPLLLDAAESNRVWLEDFADESVQVSQDLYEILLAYKKIADEKFHPHSGDCRQRRAA